MKRPLLLAAAATALLSARAEIVRPTETFFENFEQAQADGVMLPEAWVSYGIGRPVAKQFESFFGTDGAAPFYRVFNIEGNYAAWSCSTFNYATTADEWLVTPPIHIESDAEVLEFKAVSYGAYASNKYRVLISESGQDRDSFRPTPIINTNLMGWETEVRNKSSYVAINGYAGKDICLAFVNKSEDTGMLGFTDIRLSPYTVEVTDNTPSVLGAGTMVPIDILATVRTPNTVDGLKAVLTTSSGYSQTLDIDQTISIGGARVSLVFDKIEVPADGLTYNVEITPRYEGAKPTVVKGEIGVPTTSYPAVAVV